MPINIKTTEEQHIKAYKKIEPLQDAIRETLGDNPTKEQVETFTRAYYNGMNKHKRVSGKMIDEDSPVYKAAFEKAYKETMAKLKKKR